MGKIYYGHWKQKSFPSDIPVRDISGGKHIIFKRLQDSYEPNKNQSQHGFN